MRKKINKKVFCLILVIQILSHVVQADVFTAATKSTTKAAVTTKPVITTKAAATSKDEDCSDETKKTTYASCSASSSSESQGKFRKNEKAVIAKEFLCFYLILCANSYF